MLSTTERSAPCGGSRRGGGTKHKDTGPWHDEQRDGYAPLRRPEVLLRQPGGFSLPGGEIKPKESFGLLRVFSHRAHIGDVNKPGHSSGIHVTSAVGQEGAGKEDLKQALMKAAEREV